MNQKVPSWNRSFFVAGSIAILALALSLLFTIEERWLAVYNEPLSASVGRLTDLPIPHASQRVFLVSLSEAIRLVRQRANGLGLVLPEPGQWGTALEAYLAETKARLQRKALPWAEAA